MAKHSPRPWRECEWCGKLFRPNNGVRPGNRDYRRGCSLTCGNALRRYVEGHVSCPIPVKREKIDASLYHKRGKPRKGVPRVAFCRGGCGRAEIIPARQGAWTCGDCKKLYNKAAKMRRGYGGHGRRLRVLSRDGWICQICLLPIPDIPFDVANRSLHGEADHIVASSQGGPNKSFNLQAAHNLCNAAKGTSDDSTFKAVARDVLRAQVGALLAATRA